MSLHTEWAAVVLQIDHHLTKRQHWFAAPSIHGASVCRSHASNVLFK